MNAPRRKGFRPERARGASIRRLASLPIALLAGTLFFLAAAPTSAAVLVGNSEKTGSSNPNFGGQHTTIGFTTGSNSNGYTLTSIEFELSFTGSISNAERATIKAELWSSTSGRPDTKQFDLTTPASLTTGVFAAFTAPASTSLVANTTYHAVLYTTGDLTKLRFSGTLSDGEDSGAAAGWSIANNSYRRSGNQPTSGTWTSSASVPRIRVNGEITLATDATLSALTATSSTSAAGTFSALTLSPSPFAATTTEYSALVANSISHVKLTPTVNETNATVTVNGGAASTAIELAEGANAITVLVTAQDTTTTKTYMVRITRQDASGQPIWAATLTVGELSSVLFGCTDSQTAIRCTDTARLTNNTINFNSATRNVTGIVIASTNFEFSLNPEPSAALREYSLHVGGESFPLHTETGATATWDITQTWSAGQVLPVTLQRSAAVAPGGAPTELLLEQNPGKLIAFWTAPTDTGSRALSGYDVQYKLTSAANQTATTAGDPSTGWVDAAHTGTTASGEVTGLTDDTSYDVRVRAVNEGGGGPWVTGTGTPGRTLWSATLTVVDIGTDGLGCAGGAVALTCTDGDNGLTESKPVIDGAFATIVKVALNNGTLTVGFSIAPSTKLKLYSFHVGTTAFALSSATISGRELVWSNTGLTWTEGNAVSVSLRLPQSVTLPEPPSVSLSAVPSTVTEGQSVTITATLSAALTANADVVIPLTLTAGSGTDSGDYGTLASITIPSGQTSATGTITTTQDGDSNNETFTVSLGTLPATVTAGSPNSVTITITGAGTGAPTTPTVSLSVDPQRVREGDSVTVTLRLSQALTTGDASIPIILTAGSGIETGDYGTLSSITIPSGQTTGTGTITTSNDNDNTDGTFTVAIGTPPTGVSVGSPSSEVVTIDDTAPSTLILSADTLRTLQVSPGDTATITAAIDEEAPADTKIMLTYTPSNSTGAYTFDPDPPTLTIATGAKTSTGGAAFTVGEDVPIGTKIEITAIDPMSGNYSLTYAPLVIEVVSPLQAEQLHRTALPEVARAVAGRVTGAISARVGQVLNGGGNTASANLGGQSSLAGALKTHAPSLINENSPLRDLLHGSNFVLPFHTESSRGDGVRKTSLWGSGEYRNLSGENDGLEFDGNLHGAQIGVDSELRENLLAGVALSWSQGEFDYQDTGEGGGGQGDYEIDLQAIHPYLGWRSGALSWWATAGYGTGEVEITPEGSTTTSSDVNLRTIGTGGSGLLWSSGTASVRLKGEFTQTEMEVEKSEQTAALTVDATLMRLAAEASRTRSLTNGGHLSPTLSVGMRHDGGDGHTGAGAEITTGVRYTNPQTGINATATAHALVGRNDYEEWGIQATLRNSPGADGQGLSFVMRPGYGNGGGASNTGQIWSNGLRGDATHTAHDPSGQLEIRLGYGLTAPGQRNGLLTPWGGLTLQENGKLYRLGVDWASKGSFPFTLRLHGERRESANADADHAVLLNGETRF